MKQKKLNINSSEYLKLYIYNKQLAIKMQRVQIFHDAQNIKKQHLEAKTGRTTPADIDNVRVRLDFSDSSYTSVQNIKKQHLKAKTGRTTPANIYDVRVRLDFSDCSYSGVQEILNTPKKQIMKPTTVCPENIKDVRKTIRRVLF